MLPEAEIERAFALAAGARLLLCVGTSLEVHPVAGLADIALAARAARSRSSPPARRPTTTARRVKLSGDVVDELEAVVAAL